VFCDVCVGSAADFWLVDVWRVLVGLYTVVIVVDGWLVVVAAEAVEDPAVEAACWELLILAVEVTCELELLTDEVGFSATLLVELGLGELLRDATVDVVWLELETLAVEVT